MEMKILQRDDVTHIALVGRLDATGAEEIDESFSDAATAPGRPAVIDLSEIEFMGSLGIGLLFTASKKLNRAGHKLVLLNPQRMVEGVLKSSKMDTLMPIAHDLSEAIQIALGEQGEAANLRPIPSADVRKPQQEAAVATTPQAREGSVKLAIKNDRSELDPLNATLRQFLSDHFVPYRASYAVSLAIDELVVNVMRYAFVDNEAHEIDVELAVESDQVILRIVDDGRPFDPRRGPSLDLHAEDREVGGLGLTLVLDVVDVLKYERVGEENHVEVRIHLIPEDERGDLPEAAADSPGSTGA
jgi:anti-anti-sigma factor